MADVTTRSERLRSCLDSLLPGDEPGAGLESAVSGGTDDVRELLAGEAPAEDLELAVSGLDRLREGAEADEEQLDALEAIVLPRYRPVVDVLDDSYHRPPKPWRKLDAAGPRGRIETAILSVGRIEVPDHPSLPYAGTGFVVGDDLLMTNRHVAGLFATGLGTRSLRFLPGLSVDMDFKQEVRPSPPQLVHVKSVELVHPYWDCALLRCDDLPRARAVLSLDAVPLDAMEGREVVVLGYPAQDPRNDLALQSRIFRGLFQRKRLLPGTLTGRGRVRSYGRTVDALRHDSSTLGGNSGSPVIDVATGRVVGLHFAGVYLESNFAVPAWELARDGRVVDAGVAFHGERPVGDAPPWAAAWAAADGESPGGAGAPSPGPAGHPATDAGEALLGLDWYERIDDALLQEALARDRDGVRRRLEEVLGPELARETIDDLDEEPLEGLFAPEPDPSLPEIVYLHGIMGGHLANHLGTGSRVWFNFLAFAKGNVAEKMELLADGTSDAHARMRLGADGHLRLAYAKAARKWRRARFMVHEFTYDWRKTIASAADALHAFIEGLVAQSPSRRFALVAHSMGGLVSATYALRHPEWADRIESAILVGSPLGGSYAPVETALGVYPFFKTLARLSRHDDVRDLRELAVTLPGLTEMLPNPDLFDDPVDLYASATWPELRPARRWLERSRNLKALLLDSPLLPRARGLVSRQHGTVASVAVDGEGRLVAGPRSAPGDGTVPVQAAAVEPLAEVYEVSDHRHSDLMKNGGVIRAVAELLRDGATTALPRLDRSALDLTETVAAAEAPEPTDEALEGLRERMDRGLMRAADVEWLLDPLRGPLPS